MTSSEYGRALPRVRWRVQIRRKRCDIGTPRVRRGARGELGPTVGAEHLEVFLLGGRLEHPAPDPVVVVVGPSRVASLDPEVVVLAVAVDGEIPGVETAGMSTKRRLADGEHTVRRDPHEMGPRPEIVHDPLDGDDRAAPRRERTPDTFEQRRVHRHVALTIGDRGVQQCDIGDQRLEQPDLAERRVHARVAGVGLHRGPTDRPGDDRGQTASGSFQTLREGEERPMLDLDLAPTVRAGEVRVGGEVRERVPRIARDHSFDDPTAEEQRPEARQAEHDEREARVTAPPLADRLPRGGAPATVPDHEVQLVARVHVLGDSIAQGVAHADSNSPSAIRRRCQPW